MALTYRSVKGSALTIKELDDNFRHFTGSQAITGSISADSFSGSFSGSFEGDGTNLTGVTATLPAGVISSSAQIDALEFISSSVTASMSVATASFVNTLEQDLTITGSLVVSGSSIVFDADNSYNAVHITGGLDISRDLAVRDDLTVYDDTNLRKDVNVGFRDDNPGFGYSLAVTQSINTSGSAKFIGGITMETLPTTEPTVTGSLWISGSSVAHPNSGYLMIFNP